MKNRFFITAVALMAVVSGGVFARAMALPELSESFAEESWTVEERAEGKGLHRGQKLEMMADILGLSEEQKAEVESIMNAEREKTRPLRQQLRKERRKLREATAQGAFDENQVRALAASQAEARTELVVSRARVKSKIYAILTTEQQTLAEKLHPLLEGKRGHHRGEHRGR